MLRLGNWATVGGGALAAVVACTNSADLGGNANVCTAPTVEPSCEAAVDVATADEAAAIIGALAEPKFTATTSDSGAALKPSRDVHVTKGIELDAVRFRGTEDSCAGKSPANCHETWAFSGEKNAVWNFPVLGGTPARPLPAGVTCNDADCSKIAIAAGTVVRFQRVFEPFGFVSRYSHYVRVVRACATPCDSTELRCTPSTTCIQTKAFCTLCEGQRSELCACRNGCSALAEGAACSYVGSEDTTGRGACTAGTCR